MYPVSTREWGSEYLRPILLAFVQPPALEPREDRKLPFAEMAASVPLSTLSAYQGLFVHGALKPPKEGKNTGKRVLITAASGGVGLWGVQLARQAGAEVVGTCGTSNVDFVKSLGWILSWTIERWIYLDSVYELERFEEAFKKLEDGHAKGKIILRVGK
ncbi:hypothetical protein PMIN03_012713 [Paraphaeosphaeria minitans]|uniref:Zinc alcohol dehydrogenase n=1 Tax=Paraphaeosphaeria minitans TaxID=565426 RepID=A0A9P6KLX6_9PLEO|nr:zinc alcohol dehydrogenase [Paraphaeosphaeria minitans]